MTLPIANMRKYLWSDEGPDGNMYTIEVIRVNRSFYHVIIRRTKDRAIVYEGIIRGKSPMRAHIAAWEDLEKALRGESTSKERWIRLIRPWATYNGVWHLMKTGGKTPKAYCGRKLKIKNVAQTIVEPETNKCLDCVRERDHERRNKESIARAARDASEEPAGG